MRPATHIRDVTFGTVTTYENGKTSSVEHYQIVRFEKKDKPISSLTGERAGIGLVLAYPVYKVYRWVFGEQE